MIGKEEYEEALEKVTEYNQQLDDSFVTNRVCCVCKTATITKIEGSYTNPLKQEQGMWEGGVVERIDFGYGSIHDTKSYYVGICDSCIAELEDDGLATNLRSIRAEMR